MKKIKIPIYGVYLFIDLYDNIDEHLTNEQLELKNDKSVLALTGCLEYEKLYSLFMYFNLAKIKPEELEDTIDHEVLHAIFYIFHYFGVDIMQGGANEHFTYFFNYLDKEVKNTINELVQTV